MSTTAFSSLAALVGNYTGWIVPFLFTLTVIVFFHELGHFLVARWCGIRVLVFSLGFGPEIAGFTDRLGTRWKLSAIPLGGYVKFFGDENEASVPDPATLAAMSEEERKQSFFGQSVGRRAAVVVAGPLTNFILAIVLFAAVFMVVGKQIAVPRVSAVEAGSPAAAAGFQPGDLVTAIDGRRIDNFVDMQRIVGFSGGHPLTIVVDRGGVPVTLTATPEMKNNRGILGVTRSNQPGDVRIELVAAARRREARRRQNLVHRRDDPVLYPRCFRRPAVGRSDRRADRNRSNLRPGGRARVGRLDRFYRGHIGLDRPSEPVPGAASRWRPPSVLSDRSRARPAAVGAGPRGRVPHRPCNSRNVDDFCHGERHPAPTGVVDVTGGLRLLAKWARRELEGLPTGRKSLQGVRGFQA